MERARDCIPLSILICYFILKVSTELLLCVKP